MSDESKAYKLYDLVENKIMVIRNIVFEESKGWNQGKQHQRKTAGSTNNVTLMKAMIKISLRLMWLMEMKKFQKKKMKIEMMVLNMKVTIKKRQMKLKRMSCLPCL